MTGTLVLLQCLWHNTIVVTNNMIVMIWSHHVSWSLAPMFVTLYCCDRSHLITPNSAGHLLLHLLHNRFSETCVKWSPAIKRPQSHFPRSYWVIFYCLYLCMVVRPECELPYPSIQQTSAFPTELTGWKLMGTIPFCDCSNHCDNDCYDRLQFS